MKGEQGNSTGDILTKERKQTQWRQELQGLGRSFHEAGKVGDGEGGVKGRVHLGTENSLLHKSSRTVKVHTVLRVVTKTREPTVHGEHTLIKGFLTPPVEC